MKKNLIETYLTVARLDRRHAQLVVLLLTLILFVLGAGAPGDWGGFNSWTPGM